MSSSSFLRRFAAAVLLALAIATLPTALLSGQSSGASPTDIDGDGIPNDIDPDADGDGVLNVDEFGPCSTGTELTWNHNDGGGQGQAATFNQNAGAYISQASDLSFGPGLFESPDFGFTYLFGGADQPDLAGAQANGDYVQYSFTPSVPLILDQVVNGFFTGGSNATESGIDNFQLALEFATLPNFSDGVVLQASAQVPTLPPGGFGYDGVQIPAAFPAESLLPGVEYFFRVYFFDEQNNDPQNRVRFDDHFVRFSVAESCFLDDDGDGIPNHLDLDEDGDGVLDVPPPTTTTTTTTTTTAAPTTTTTAAPTTTVPPTTTTVAPTTTTAAPTTTTTAAPAPTTTAAPAPTTTAAPAPTTTVAVGGAAGAVDTTTTAAPAPTTTAAAAIGGDSAAVGSDSTQTDPPVLALTGPSDDPLALIGVLSLVIGSLILLADRRRNADLG